jgi:hypothetical protein
LINSRATRVIIKRCKNELTVFDFICRDTHHGKRFLILFIFLLLSAIPFTAYGDIPDPEREALVALYDATDGNNSWTNKSGGKMLPYTQMVFQCQD